MKYRVFMKVFATGVVEVEADSVEEAMQRAAEEYTDIAIGMCHQCAGEVSDPTYGDPVEAYEAED